MRAKRQTPGVGMSADAAPAEERPHVGRFWGLLLLICVVGAVLRVLLVSQYLTRNPLAEFLRVDALTYWKWAGRIAAGQWSDGHPFFSAPLYPYLLGLLRAAGGGLPLVYCGQALLDAVTAVVIGGLARRLFGPLVGWLAAATYVVLLEPASFTLRVLPGTLQLLLVALAWAALVRAWGRWTLAQAVLAGALVGLLALAWPPAMLALPVVALWWVWNTRPLRVGLVRAAAVAAAGAAVISPATIHNYCVSRELFAIQAVSGLTLRQGNGPGAAGVIIMVPGTSTDREALFESARADFRRRYGREGTWGEIDRQYRDGVFAWWREDPTRTARLFAAKLYWFLTGRHFADIYMPTAERAAGLLPRLWLTPVHTAWLIPPALVALGGWLRRPREHLPALLLFAVVVATVVVFRYSPRYRLPAIPVLAVGAAWTLSQAVRHGWRSRWAVAAAASVAVSGGLTALNAARGFDSLAAQQPLFEYSLATAAVARGDSDDAERRYRSALEQRPDLEEVRLDLAELLRHQGRHDEALTEARRVLQFNPDSARAHTFAGISLAMSGRAAEAAEHFHRVLVISPHDSDAHVNLGNTLAEQGRVDEAVEHFRRAVELNPDSAAAWYNLGQTHIRRGSVAEAVEAFQRALRLEPKHVRACSELAYLLARQGDYEVAAATLRAGLRHWPADIRLANDLAWLLATCPKAEVRNGAEALLLASNACLAAGQPPPGLLDTLAAALAEAGRFDEAVTTATRAADLAAGARQTELAEAIRARAQLYAARQPYREPSP
ncbi:MAG: tetratricopeptide repeat protein [Planctomycetota bacterium]